MSVLEAVKLVLAEGVAVALGVAVVELEDVEVWVDVALPVTDSVCV